MSISFFISFMALLIGSQAKVVQIKTADEFNALVKKENVLVKFYAPWCGHCKKLAPEYIKAAEELSKTKVADIKLAELDCTDSKTSEVCKVYEVKGYPTIKYFSKQNKNPLDFEGARDKDGLVSFAKKVIRKAILLITTQNQLDDLIKDNNIVIVEFAEKNSKKFEQIANDMRLKYTFATVQNQEIMKKHEIADNSIAMFRSFDDPITVFEEKNKKLSDWIDDHSFPIIGEMHGENYRKYFEKNVPVCWFAIDKKDQTIYDKVHELSTVFKKNRDKLLAIYVDTNKFKDALISMGFGEKYPSVMIFDKDQKYKFEGDLNADEIEEFILKFNKGELKKFYRSEKIPKDNKGPIIEVVGDTFEKIVLDEEHDVVLEYYLSYCKHCKKFAPEYQKVGELYKDEVELKIAKINGEHNDTPEKISGYPTVVLFPMGQKDKPIYYTDDLKADKVEKWLVNNAPSLKKRAEKKKEEQKKTEKEEL